MNETTKTIALELFRELFESSSESESDDDDLYGIFFSETGNDVDDIIKQYIENERITTTFEGNSFDDVLSKYSGSEYKENFKISKELFENLAIKFSDYHEYQAMQERRKFSSNTHIAVFLWFACHKACRLEKMVKIFNCSADSISLMISRVINFFCELYPNIKKWPTKEKQLESSKFFQEKYGLQKVIGSIGLTRIIIDAPMGDDDNDIDHEGNVTICLQAICDEKNKFIDIDIGQPGSYSVSTVLQYSSIYGKLSTVCGEYFLIGNPAYTNSKFVITSKIYEAEMENNQLNYTTIEHTFNLLKERFEQMHHTLLRDIRKNCKYITACCILHNIIVEEEHL